MFYLIILFILFVFACFDLSANEKLKNVFFAIGIILLALIAGLRYETGIDWYAYEMIYFKTPKLYDISSADLLSRLDLGYFFLVSAIKTLNGSIQVVFLVMACIGFFFLYKSLSIYTPYKNTALFIYFCLIFLILDMSGMRQAVALNIFFFALQYIPKKKAVKYFLLILLAFLFHWSALIFVPFYFIFNKRIPLWPAVATVAACAAIAFFKVTWIQAILEFVYEHISHEGLKAQLELYVLNPHFSQPAAFGKSVIVVFIIFGLLTFYREKLENRFPYFNLFYNMYLLQVFFLFALFENTDISMRLYYYALTSTIILLPYLLYLFKDYKKYIFYFGLLIYGFWNMKGYILNETIAIAYNPYQNYAVHKIFKLKSDGGKRLKAHKKLFEQQKDEDIEKNK